MRVVELKKGSEALICKSRIATTFVPRLMGLMLRSGIGDDEAIVFPKCNSIHTFFMRFPIDVLFVAKNGQVVEIQNSLGPWRMLMPRKNVSHTVEMRSHRAKELGICEGDQLQCEGVFP